MKHIHSKGTISSHEKIAVINLIMHVLPQRRQCLLQLFGIEIGVVIYKKEISNNRAENNSFNGNKRKKYYTYKKVVLSINQGSSNGLICGKIFGFQESLKCLFWKLCRKPNTGIYFPTYNMVLFGRPLQLLSPQLVIVAQCLSSKI